MDFTIDIGFTSDRNNKYNKTVNYIANNVPISTMSTINQLSPVFIINRDDRLLGANYVNATFLGRKYFCTISIDTAQRMVLTCNVDYVSSFDLSDCDITVLRNGGIGKPTEIPDSKLPILPNRQTVQQTVDVNSALNPNAERCYVLGVIGGDINAT